MVFTASFTIVLATTTDNLHTVLQIGPLLGGFLTEAGGWEAIFWLLFALGATMVVVMFFFMEESYRDEELYSKTEDVNESKEDEQCESDDITITYTKSKKMNLLAPLVSALAQCHENFELYNDVALSQLLLRHPFVLIPAVETGFTFGCMFAIENILPTLYTNVYGWSPGSIGLSFLSPGIGEVSSSFY